MALCCVLGQDTLLLEPGPLDPGTSALTMRPPRLPLKNVGKLNLYTVAFKLKLEVCKTVCYRKKRKVTYKNEMKM